VAVAGAREFPVREPRRMAFAYHPLSFGATDIARAAEGLCRLLWIIDTSVADSELMANLLRRLGSVVDVAGASPAQAAERIAAERPDGILALADSLLAWTAEVAAHLALPFHSPQVAACLTDKLHQREALAAAGVDVPRFSVVPSAGDDGGWRELGGRLRFPALLKPRRGEGSRDVVAVGSLEELRAAVAQARAQPEPPVWPRHGFLVEEYLADRPDGELGGYVSVESIVSAGEVSHIAVTGRMPPVEPFRESGFFVPAALDGEELAAVLELATAAVRALGVTTGGLHTEVKLTPKGPRVIEVNGRVGGGTPAMLAAACGVELLPITMRLALGEHVTISGPLPCRGVVFVLYSFAPATVRRVLAVEGLERLRADPCVERVILNRGPGTLVGWREGSWGHVFSVHGRAESHEQLRAVARLIRAETRILGE
jgi:biotin carboxylase